MNTKDNRFTYGIIAAIAVGTVITVVGVILGTLVLQTWYALFAFGEVVTFGAIFFHWWQVSKRGRQNSLS